MKKLVTIALTIALIGTVANAAPIAPTLEVSSVDAGGGITGYTFWLDNHDGENGVWATTSLTFEGAGIQQIAAFGGGMGVHDEATANGQDGNMGYVKAQDTWIFSGWPDMNLPPADTNQTGNPGPGNGAPVILSIGSGITLVEDKNLVYIAAIGEVTWHGSITRVTPIEGGIIVDVQGMIPEPATMGLMLFGAIGVIARKRRRS